VGDYTTRSILEQMIREEEEHVDTLETQLEIINQIGIDLYLNRQIHSAD
jgi:bacterioferritin